jgi:hypothetical protein
MSKSKKKQKKRSPLGSSVPPRYTQSGQWTRYLTEIDNYARKKKKKKKTPRALRHPHN